MISVSLHAQRPVSQPVAILTLRCHMSLPHQCSIRTQLLSHSSLTFCSAGAPTFRVYSFFSTSVRFTMHSFSSQRLIEVTLCGTGGMASAYLVSLFASRCVPWGVHGSLGAVLLSTLSRIDTLTH